MFRNLVRSNSVAQRLQSRRDVHDTQESIANVFEKHYAELFIPRGDEPFDDNFRAETDNTLANYLKSNCAADTASLSVPMSLDEILKT